MRLSWGNFERSSSFRKNAKSSGRLCAYFPSETRLGASGYVRGGIPCESWVHPQSFRSAGDEKARREPSGVGYTRSPARANIQLAIKLPVSTANASRRKKRPGRDEMAQPKCWGPHNARAISSAAAGMKHQRAAWTDRQNGALPCPALLIHTSE